MSKTTNDGLTRSGTRYFIAVPIWQQWAWTVKRTVCVAGVCTELLSIYCVTALIQTYEITPATPQPTTQHSMATDCHWKWYALSWCQWNLRLSV